jgi:hypothetical protein
MRTLYLKFLIISIFLSIVWSTKGELVFETTTGLNEDITYSGKIAEEKNRLINLAYEYLRFVHDVGSALSVQVDDPRLEILFAEDLTKIDNRSILFERSRQSLLPQMKGFKKEDDPAAYQVAWVIDIDNALVIPSVETNSVIVHFEWTHVNVGRATTIAILQCNSYNQIQQIIDVWAPVRNM